VKIRAIRGKIFASVTRQAIDEMASLAIQDVHLKC
jgi:hypothetical protein